MALRRCVLSPIIGLVLTATVQAHPSVSLVAVSHVHTHELWLGPDGSLYGDDVHVCRLAPEGKGEAEPVADSETADGPALNRRVEVVRR